MFRLSTFFEDDSGATAVEYGLIASLVAVALIPAANAVGINLSSLFTRIADLVDF